MIDNSATRRNNRRGFNFLFQFCFGRLSNSVTELSAMESHINFGFELQLLQLDLESNVSNDLKGLEKRLSLCAAAH